MKSALGAFAALALILCSAQAAEGPPPTTGKVVIKYKDAKDVSFEQMIIQGQLKRPEVTVVTGDSERGTDGLLRLRESFLDHTAAAIGEEASGASFKEASGASFKEASGASFKEASGASSGAPR